MFNLANNWSKVQDKNSKEYIKEIYRLKVENYESSKQVAELKEELTELGKKL